MNLWLPTLRLEQVSSLTFLNRLSETNLWEYGMVVGRGCLNNVWGSRAKTVLPINAHIGFQYWAWGGTETKLWKVWVFDLAMLICIEVVYCVFGTSSECSKPQFWSLSKSFKWIKATNETCHKDHVRDWLLSLLTVSKAIQTASHSFLLTSHVFFIRSSLLVLGTQCQFHCKS